MRFEEGKLVIDDLKSPIVKAGDFEIEVYLVKDGVKLIERDVSVKVHNLIEEPDPVEAPEKEREF